MSTANRRDWTGPLRYRKMSEVSKPGRSTGESRRRVVLHPRTATARQQDRARSFGSHVRGYTVDTDDVLSLMRRQRSGALRVISAIIVPTLALPVLFTIWPALAQWRPLGPVPFAWLALGPITLFTVVGVAFVHERRARSREQAWAAGHSDHSRMGPERPGIDDDPADP